MKEWMRIGLEALPECGDIIKRSSNSMRMWIDLYSEWPRASINVRVKMAKFAKRCLSMKGDVVNAVCCGFIEHAFDERSNWEVLVIAFSKDDIEGMKWLWDYNYRENCQQFMNDLLKYWGKHKT